MLRNFDELFGLPYNFAAVPDVVLDRNEIGWLTDINDGVMFLHPSTAVFETMLTTISSAQYPAAMAEQAFLNVFYGANMARLPYAYNANLAIKARSLELWKNLMEEARVIHYTIRKPSLTEKCKPVKHMIDLERNVADVANKHGLYHEEFENWLAAWNATYRTYGEAFAQCERKYPTSQ